MKASLLILLACLGINQGASAQGFVNLNFENCTVPTNIAAFVSTTEAFPAWSVYRGGILQNIVAYNAVVPQQSYLGLASTATSYPPLFGNYNAWINLSFFDTVDVALAQAGQVPGGVSWLQFATSGDSIPPGGLVVSFDNTTLSLQPVGFFPGYTLWQADISAFAGTTGELRFNFNHSGGPWGGYLDDIAFLPVPEPSIWALIALGTALFAVMARRRDHR